MREDFNGRCGYCDVLDKPYGGQRVFHIDHFRPQKYFSDLKSDYNNLVYACRYCNGGKRDDWPAGTGEHCVVDGKGYVDPCDRDFDNHFARYDDGRICPQTDVGNYMFQKLKLGLRRHQLAWMYEKLEYTLNNLRAELKNFSEPTPIKEQLMNYQSKVVEEFFKYKCAFEKTLNE